MCNKIIINRLQWYGHSIYKNRAKFILIISVMLHMVDIISDIIVTSDLYNENSPYFTISLGILIFSFVGSALLSLDDDKFIQWVAEERKTMIQEPKCNKLVLRHTYSYTSKMIQWMFLDITQINYFKDCFTVLFSINGTYVILRKERIIVKKMIEGLLESGPESLLQLFLILKQSVYKGYLDLLTYYISLKFSLLNLTYTLVAMDYYYLDKLITPNFDIYDNLPDEDKYDFDWSQYEPSYLSAYLLNVILFRLTEVFSRVGLLACISQIYDGYYLFLFIFIDFVCLNILNGLKRFIRYKVEKCEFSIYTLEMLQRSQYIESFYRFQRNRKIELSKGFDFNKSETLDWNRVYSAYKILLCWKVYKKDKLRNIFRLKCTIQEYILPRYNTYMNKLREENIFLQTKKKEIYDSKYWLEVFGLRHILDSIKYLGVYYKPISWKLMRDKKYKCISILYRDSEIPLNLPDSNRWWNRISMHFISKYINNAIITFFLIYKLLTESYTDTIVVISISSMICYIINIMSLRLLIKWNNKEEEEFRKFIVEPLINIRCKTICCCYSTKKKDNNVEETKTIEDGESVTIQD